MFWKIILLTIALYLVGQIHPVLMIALSIPLMLWGFRRMYTAKRDLKPYRNGELIIDPRTGMAVANPNHPKNQRRHAGSLAAAAAGTSVFNHFDSSDGSSLDSSSVTSEMDEIAINPANGMPMVGGIGGVDIEGNPYGTDSGVFTDDHSMFDDTSGCGMDDSFISQNDAFGCGMDDSTGSGFDDW